MWLQTNSGMNVYQLLPPRSLHCQITILGILWWVIKRARPRSWWVKGLNVTSAKALGTSLLFVRQERRSWLLSAMDLSSCVIHQVLLENKREMHAKNYWQCTNIFHARMEHGDWALNVIIDNNSGINVISQNAMERLSLKVEKHPTSYRVRWINEDNLILVKYQCLIKFSLGQNMNIRLGFTMTICHMLLGRPWL